MSLQYSIENLNLNNCRKRSGSNSSRNGINNYEMVQPGGQPTNHDGARTSVAATILDSVLFGQTAQGELTRQIFIMLVEWPINSYGSDCTTYECLALVP